MRYAKFISKYSVQFSTNPIWTDAEMIANPTENQLMELGYKSIIEESKPGIKDNYYLIPYYEDGEIITKKWEVHENQRIDEEDVLEDLTV